MKRKFKKFYKFYVIILFLLSVVAVSNVFFSLKKYESNQPEKFIQNKLISLNEEQIKQLFKNNTEYEKETDLTGNIKSYFKAKDYKIKKQDNFLYEILVNDKKVLDIILNSKKHINKFGLISYDELEIKEIKTNENQEFLSYVIMVPSSYNVKINDIDATLTSEEKIADFEDGYEYASIPKINKYEIHNLTKIPDIKITYNNEQVKFEKNNIIDLSKNFNKYDSLKDANIDFDVLKFAENWSLFLTNDLSGAMHGLDTITKDLINKTKLYNHAYKWATNVDITFTSKHQLKNPVFTNEKISNIIVYNDSSFSCDVYLEKNMIVVGKDKIDKFNSTLYFIKYNNEWKVINMKGVTQN